MTMLHKTGHDCRTTSFQMLPKRQDAAARDLSKVIEKTVAERSLEKLNIFHPYLLYCSIVRQDIIDFVYKDIPSLSVHVL